MIAFIKSEIAIDYLIIFAFFAFIYFVSCLFSNNSKRKYTQTMSEIKYLVLPAMVMAIIGLTIGLLAGNSRASIMDSVIPAVLTFLSGFIFFVFSSSKMTDRKKLILVSSLSFVVFLMVGTWSGASNRMLADNNERAWQKELLLYTTDLEVYKYKQEKLVDLQLDSIK